MRLLLLTFLAASFFVPATAQNLYDREHSIEFASYLFKSQQYELAAIEYERLVFVSPSNDTLKEALIRSYSLNRKFESAINRLTVFSPDPHLLPGNLANLYTYNLLALRQYDPARLYLGSTPVIPSGRKLYYTTYANLFQRRYATVLEVLKLLEPLPDSLLTLRKFAQEGLALPHKSPFLAGALSTVIPGSGKFYTRDWKDGLISMIMIGALGFQTYRGFHRDGINSTFGWVYGSIACGFYIGNIYGSIKSAKRFNKRKAEKLEKRIEDSFYLRP